MCVCAEKTHTANGSVGGSVVLAKNREGGATMRKRVNFLAPPPPPPPPCHCNRTNVCVWHTYTLRSRLLLVYEGRLSCGFGIVIHTILYPFVGLILDTVIKLCSERGRVVMRVRALRDDDKLRCDVWVCGYLWYLLIYCVQNV